MGAAMTTLPPGFTKDKKAGDLPSGFVRDRPATAPTTIPTMLEGMETPVYGPGQAAPAPAMKKPASAMDWFRGGKTEAQIQDEKATEVRNLKAQAAYEALPGYVKPFQAASDLLTVGRGFRLP